MPKYTWVDFTDNKEGLSYILVIIINYTVVVQANLLNYVMILRHEIMTSEFQTQHSVFYEDLWRPLEGKNYRNNQN